MTNNNIEYLSILIIYYDFQESGKKWKIEAWSLSKAEKL